MYAGLRRIELSARRGGAGDSGTGTGGGRREAEDLARRLSRRASAGDIIVMHDGHHVEPARRSPVRRRGDGADDPCVSRERVLVRDVVRSPHGGAGAPPCYFGFPVIGTKLTGSVSSVSIPFSVLRRIRSS